MDLRPRLPPEHHHPHQPSSSLTPSWANGLIPVFALTRLVKALLRRPGAQIKTSPSRFPRFEGDELRWIVSFGDSYTDTGFDHKGIQPWPGNPLGNPAWPGRTFSNGPNWIEYLTVQYNQSYIETLNFAAAGAVLDREAIGTFLPLLPSGIAPVSVEEQIRSHFLPLYTSPSPSSFGWSPENTLFAIWVGMNDVSAVWWAPNRTAIYDESFATYRSLLDVLYANGARKVLVMNVTPFHRTPANVGWPREQSEMFAGAIGEWNDRLVRAAAKFMGGHEDVRAGVVDVYSLLDGVQDFPCANVVTCPIRDTEGYCWPGWPEVIERFGRGEGCGLFEDQYMFRDAWHVGWRVHEVVADAVARLLWRLDD